MWARENLADELDRDQLRDDVGGPEPGGVGGRVVGLVLGLTLGRHPGLVVLDLAAPAGSSSQPSTRGHQLGHHRRGRQPRSQVSIEIRVRRVSTSSRCRAPSWVTAYTTSAAQVVLGAGHGSARLGSLRDQIQHLVDQRAVAAEQVLDAGDVQARTRRPAAWRWLFHAPGSRRRRPAAICSVHELGTRSSRPRTAASTASSAITR